MKRHSRFALPAVLLFALALAGCGGNSIAAADIEEEVSAQLAATVGETPEDVECPDDVPAEVGETTRCVLTAEDGTQIGVTVTVTEVSDGEANFDIEVDDEVMEPGAEEEAS